MVGAGSKKLRSGVSLCDTGVVGSSLLFVVGDLRGGVSRQRPLKALRGFWVPESVLEQVQASLAPPKRDAGNAGEKALSDYKAQLHILRQRLTKQRTAVVNAQEDFFERSHEKLVALADEVDKLDVQYRELSVDPLTPSSSKVASEMGDGHQLEEVQSSTDDMDHTNRLGDPPGPMNEWSPCLRSGCGVCAER